MIIPKNIDVLKSVCLYLCAKRQVTPKIGTTKDARLPEIDNKFQNIYTFF